MTNSWRVRFFPVTLIILFIHCLALSQRIIVNSQGEHVVMYPDGSWRMAGPGDSLLVRQYSKPPAATSSDSVPANAQTQRNKAEEQEYLLLQWNELFLLIRSEDKKVQNQFRAATNAQFTAAERLHNAEDNKGLIDPDKLEALNKEYDQSVLNLRNAKLRQQDIKSIYEKAKKINENLPGVTESKYSRIKSNYAVYLHTYDPGREIIITPAVKEPKQELTPITVTADMASSSIMAYDPSMTGQLPTHRKPRPYFSEPYQCTAITDSTDSTTKTRKIILKPDLIFTHTDPDLRPFFKDKDLITCSGQLSKIGPYIYLTLDFQIASSHSQSNFGSLQNGSLLRLKLMDGEYITLYNLKSDKGRIDPYSGYTIFSSQYGLGKTEMKKLGKKALDEMRVLWSTGYEDYDVHHIDFLKNQIKCLMAKEK